MARFEDGLNGTLFCNWCGQEDKVCALTRGCRKPPERPRVLAPEVAWPPPLENNARHAVENRFERRLIRLAFSVGVFIAAMQVGLLLGDCAPSERSVDRQYSPEVGAPEGWSPP